MNFHLPCSLCAVTPEGSVLVMPQNVSISKGNSVTFICVFDVAGSDLQWSHNGEELSGQNQTLLNVNAVTAAQGGNYTCSVVNGSGSVMDEGILYGTSHCSTHAQRAYVSVSQTISNSFTVILTCWLFPLLLTVNASFVQHPMSAVISVGENITLSCSAAGFPAPDVDWTRDGVKIQGSSRIEIKTLSQGLHTSQSCLTISSASVNLTGMYRCFSITTIEGFPPEIVESTSSTITVQGMQYTSRTMDKYSYCSSKLQN